MSIAEKLKTIAENEQKVYQAGYNSAVDESKLIEKTVSGRSSLFVDDVSEVRHKCSVQLSNYNSGTTPEVVVSGKNLLHFKDYTLTTGQQTRTTNNGVISMTTAEAVSLYTLVNDAFVAGAWIGAIRFPAGRYTYTGTAEYKASSTTQTAKMASCLHIKLEDGTDMQLQSGVITFVPQSFSVFKITTVNDSSLINFVANGSFTLEPMLETGRGTSDFEAHTENRYTANTSGVAIIESKSPDMFIYTDVDADISLNYYKSWTKQAEYDRLWDTLQDYGNRISYAYGFCGNVWDDLVFNPKYPITATLNANNLFAFSNLTDTKVPIDIGTTSGNKSHMFQGSKLVTIRKIITNADGNVFNSAFTSCSKLQNIEFEGIIYRNFNVQSSPLTVASMKNIIEHLNNYKGTADEGTYTITFKAECWEALNQNSAPPEYETWQDYITNVYGYNCA